MEFPDFIPNPLHHSPEGVIKFNGSRVTLHSVLWAFKTGETPEGIIDCFPTLSLATVYTAIAYYLHNKEEVETYLSQQEQEAKEMREVWEAEYPPKVSREEPQSRRLEIGDDLSRPRDRITEYAAYDPYSDQERKRLFRRAKLANRIKESIAASSLPRGEIAQYIEASLDELELIELGQLDISQYQVEKLAPLVGRSVEFFLGME